MAEVSLSFNGTYATIYPYFECYGTVSTLSSQSFRSFPNYHLLTLQEDHDRTITGKRKLRAHDEEAYSEFAI